MIDLGLDINVVRAIGLVFVIIGIGLWAYYARKSKEDSG